MPRHKNRKLKLKKWTRKMRGGDGTMAPEQPTLSSPSWFTNLATRIKTAASNLTAKIRNIKWSGTTAEQQPKPAQEQPSNMIQNAQAAAENAGQKVQAGFDSTTKKLEEGYEKAKDTVGGFFDTEVKVPQLTQNQQQNQQQMVMAGGKRRKMTKRRKMRGGFAAYNEYTVAQTASPVEGIKTAEPTYMINASLTNSLCGGKRRTKRGKSNKRKSKGRKKH
uniref:Uncharacterized protein n=1 Tax=viral metagenome TaxID=1070528 RepID=A0A6C0F6F3_9ZZZZ